MKPVDHDDLTFQLNSLQHHIEIIYVKQAFNVHSFKITNEWRKKKQEIRHCLCTLDQDRFFWFCISEPVPFITHTQFFLSLEIFFKIN